MKDLIEIILGQIKEDAKVKEVRVGPFWTAVHSRGCGLSSTLFEHDHAAGPPVKEPGKLKEKSALELAALAKSESTLERSIGLAAINSLLEVDDAGCVQVNAADLLIEHGKDKTVCLVGHFPFVPRLEETAGKLFVLERRPRMNDLPAEKAKEVIPQADLVAITGTALLNGTMDELLALCRPESKVMVLGPTTPLTSLWFEQGVDFISGTVVTNPQFVLDMVAQGVVFSQFKGRGVKLLSMQR